MKFNKKTFNAAAWITLIITYILPYQSTNGIGTKFGYPFPFLTVYTTINISLLKSFYVNILTFTIDIFIVYFVISFTSILFSKKDLAKNNRRTEYFL